MKDKKKIVWWIIGAIVIVALLIGGFIYNKEAAENLSYFLVGTGFFMFFFNRSLEVQRSQLQEDREIRRDIRLQELEQFRIEHSGLYEKRADKIYELHELMCNLYISSLQLVNISQPKSKDKDTESEECSLEQKIDECFDQFKKVKMFTLFNQVYITRELTDKLLRFYNECISEVQNYSYDREIWADPSSTKEERREAILNISQTAKRMNNDILPLMDELRDEFRKLLGVPTLPQKRTASEQESKIQDNG